MNSRQAVIYFSQTSKKEIINTTAKTWGELQGAISGSISDKTCVLSRSRLILALPDAELPTDTFTVFVYPKESKGGMTKKKVKKVKKAVKKAAKKPAKKAKKVAPKKKAKSKPAKKSKKKVSSKKSTSLGNVLSSVESAKIANDEALRSESAEIGSQLKGFR